MVFYKSIRFFEEHQSNTFDAVYPPGTKAPHPGIYRCATCGFEVAVARNGDLPATEHCPQHSPEIPHRPGEVQWKLVAAANDLTIAIRASDTRE